MKEGMNMKRVLAGLIATCCVAVCSAADSAAVPARKSKKPVVREIAHYFRLASKEHTVDGKSYHKVFFKSSTQAKKESVQIYIMDNKKVLHKFKLHDNPLFDSSSTGHIEECPWFIMFPVNNDFPPNAIFSHNQPDGSMDMRLSAAFSTKRGVIKH